MYFIGLPPDFKIKEWSQLTMIDYKENGAWIFFALDEIRCS